MPPSDAGKIFHDRQNLIYGSQRAIKRNKNLSKATARKIRIAKRRDDYSQRFSESEKTTPVEIGCREQDSLERHNYLKVLEKRYADKNSPEVRATLAYARCIVDKRNTYLGYREAVRYYWLNISESAQTMRDFGLPEEQVAVTICDTRKPPKLKLAK